MPLTDRTKNILFGILLAIAVLVVASVFSILLYILANSLHKTLYEWHYIDIFALTITAISIILVVCLVTWGTRTHLTRNFVIYSFFMVIIAVILPLYGALGVLSAEWHCLVITVIFLFINLYELFVKNILGSPENLTSDEKKLHTKIHSLQAVFDFPALIAFALVTILAICFVEVWPRKIPTTEIYTADVVVSGAIGLHMIISGIHTTVDFSDLLKS
jgi:hypothetical protein